MYAVGRLGSYITQGVYTVAGPFHPFGGAVDIIVVEQQDGSFKSSPWYVRFGKFQGVLKSKEKVVDISVDGVQADFNMYLDHRGQAYFLREVECEEGDSLFYPSSSGEETDGQVSNRMPLKTKSCNYDSHPPSSVTRIDVSNGKIVTRTSSRRFLGLVFGRKSMKDNSFGEEEDGSGVVRADSLERAEIAADLLEVRWSTNLDVSKHRKDSSLDQDVVNEEIRNHRKKIDTSSRFGRQKLGSPNEDLGVEMSCLNDGLGENYVINSQTIMEIDELVVMNADHDKISETESPVLDSAEIDANPCKNLDEELDFEKNNGVSEGESEAELISEVYSVQKASLLEAKEAPDIPKLLVDRKDDNSFSDGQIPVSVEIYSNSFENSIVTKTYCQTVTVDPINVLAKSVETSDCFTISDLKKSFYGDLGGGTSYGDSQENVNIVTAEGVVVSPSEGSEEEQLLFGEFDDFSYREGNCTESYSSSHLVEEYPTLVKSQNDVDDVRERSRIVSSSISIPKRNRVDHEDIGRMAESLPNMWPPINGVVLEDFQHPLGHSLDSNFEALIHNAPEEDVSSCVKSDADKEEEVFGAKSNVKDAQMTEELINVPSSITNGDPSKLINPSNGSWRVWPFSFRRSKSMNNSQQIQNSTGSLEAENNLRSPISTDGEKDALKPKGKKKKKVRVLIPTPEQLASLNLKEGKNTVTFTFSTSMLGPQKVDAKIYLWKWDTRIVISDVDGTITKSDVLGQFMPMVGMDWSQTGVTHLFSAIKENGYQLLFLSARAISQAYHTRQFLFNLKQDGKALPDGPVVISPDGLFPSLFREVIRRAPHEFKIACLEDIRALFPSDRSPFYAGFGNRDTDEISYLKVGIPKGKIFIINPKGEVVVNRRVDGKSYHSLKALVHDMFPPMSSCEQEDFNSWNYWKLPPPAIDL